MGVEQLAEAVQKVATFQAAAPGVDKHQQGADVWSQPLHLHTVTTRGCHTKYVTASHFDVKMITKKRERFAKKLNVKIIINH